MTRKKVKLMWITNDAARKASLKKRRFSLLKKVSELTTLCGVDAFVIIYGPDDSEPTVWPSPSVIQQLLTRFQNMSDFERHKRMIDQESYLKGKISKTQQLNKKHQKKNMELEMSCLMCQFYQEKRCENFEVSELCGLAGLVEEKINEIRQRIEFFEQVFMLPPGSCLLKNPKIDEMGQIEGGSSSGDRRNNPITANPALSNQWFIDMMNKNNSTGSSSTNNDMLLPHPYNILGSSSGGVDLGHYYGNIVGSSSSETNFDVGLITNNIGGSTSGNYFVSGLLDENIARDRSGMGLFYDNIGGNTIGGNTLYGLGPPHVNVRDTNTGENAFPRLSQAHHGNIGDTSADGGDIGLSNISKNANDIGWPFDVTKTWP